MCTAFRSSLLVASTALLLAGCGGSSSNNVSCGAGTHDGGNQTCVIDNAIAIVNSNSYWRCTDNGGGAEFIQIVPGSSSTAGTGRYQFQANPVQPVYSFTWSEAIPSTDAMTWSFASGPPWNELKNIAPNALVNPTGFTGTVVSNNSSGTFSCTLVGGTF